MNTQMEEPKYSHTKYPKIYINSRWGRQSYCNISDKLICENRDKFTELFNIKKCYSKVTRKVLIKSLVLTENKKITYKDNYHFDKFRDHEEHYVMHDGNIITIFTYPDYDSPSSEKGEEHIINNGYTLFDPLYSSSYKSYYKIIIIK